MPGARPTETWPDSVWPGALHVDLRLLALAQDELGMAIQRRAGLGGRDAALGAHEQLLLELVFERDQLLAQRRLGDVKHFGGLRQAADIDDLHEVLESSQVHVRRPWSTLSDGNNDRAKHRPRTVLKNPLLLRKH